MLVFKNFINLSLEEKKEILRQRNSSDVAKFCLKKYISLDEHLNFIESLKNDKTKLYMLVLKEEEMLGVISFSEIKEQEAFFGLYKISKGKMGNLLMQAMLDKGFKDLKLKNIKARVLKQNTKAIKLYEKFGFKTVAEEKEYLIIECKTGGGIKLLSLNSHIKVAA